MRPWHDWHSAACAGGRRGAAAHGGRRGGGRGRLEQLRSERAALEEHKAELERELAAARGALDGRRAERSKLQDEARRAKCAAGGRPRNSSGLHLLGCT